jgi:NitT/TauT family transport system permease protein
MRTLKHYAPTIVIFFAVLALWEGLIRIFKIEQFLLPAPSVIAAAFVETFDVLLAAAGTTLYSALTGFVLGCGSGALVAFAAARWSGMRKGLLPFAIAANSVPIVAFAPIMNQWFGSTNPMSKAMIVAVITFFPMMINMVRGLTLVEPAKLELMRSLASTPAEVLFKVRLPNALPYVFNALKVCITLSLIGAIVGEFFGGPREALGVYIRSEAALFRFPNAWAAILVCAVAGILLYLLVLGLERLVIPWKTQEGR